LYDQGVEVASKCLRANEIGAYFDRSSHGTPSIPSTQSTLITPESEDAPNEEQGGLLHPIGRKAAKRKVEKVEDPVLDIMTKELS